MSVRCPNFAADRGKLLERRRPQLLRGTNHLERGVADPSRLEQLGPLRGEGIHQRRAHALQGVQQAPPVGQILIERDDQARARQQRQEQFHRRPLMAGGARGDQHVALAHAGPLRQGKDQIGQTAMRDGQRLRYISGCGEQQAGSASGVQRFAQLEFAAGRLHRQRGVQVDRVRGAVGIAQPLVSAENDRRGLGRRHRLGAVLRGIFGVEGHVRGAGLQNPEQCNRQFERPCEADAYRRCRCNAARAQVLRHPIRPFVEFRVGQLLLVAGERDRIGSAGHLRLEQLHQGQVARIQRARIVQLVQQRPRFGRCAQRQLRDPALRMRNGVVEQVLDVRQHARRGGFVELIRVALARKSPAIRPFDHEEIQIVDRTRRQGRHVGQREVAVGRVLDEGLLENEIDRDGGTMRMAALALDHAEQALDGNMPMFQRLARDLAHPVDEFVELRVVAQIGAQNEGIDELADHRLEFHLVAIRDLGADDDFALAGVAGEHGAQCGERTREQGCAALRGQRLSAIGEFSRQQTRHDGPVGRRHAGTRVIGDYAEGLHARQLAGPVLGLGRDAADPQPFQLPQGVVGVLDRQGFERNGRTAAQCGVDRTHLACHDPDGPSIGDDLMRGHQDDGERWRESQQRHADHGTAAEIERRTRFDHADPVGLDQLLIRRQRRQVDLGQSERRGRHDALYRRTVDLEELAAQDFVAVDDGEPGMLEQIGRNPSFEPPAHRDVVRGVARIQAIQQPEPFLRDRTGKIGARRVGLFRDGPALELRASGLCHGDHDVFEDSIRRLRHYRPEFEPLRRLRWNWPSVGSGLAPADPTSVCTASARPDSSTAVRCCNSCFAVILMPARLARAVI